MAIDDKLFFHEDDYRQVEILPYDSFFSVTREVSEITGRTEKDFDERGFKHIHSRSQINKSLETAGITRELFHSILKKESNVFFGKVFRGYSTYEEGMENCKGFGYGNYILLYESKNNIVSASWIIYRKMSETPNTYHTHLQTTLMEIGRKWNLLLIDWNELIIVNLSRPEAISNYLAS